MADGKKGKAPPNIVDRPMNAKGKGDVSLSAFSFLFSELIQYTHRKVHSIKDLERRLADIGHSVGLRLLEYSKWREKAQQRESKYVRILFFISSTVWKMLFGKEASLEKSADKEQYMISENEPLVSKFISTPKDMTQLNCAAFVAGIVEGILDAAEFPARVSTHSQEVKDRRFPRTVILIEFEKEVIERESKTG